MLPPFIIDQIRRRENQVEGERPQPQLELPIDDIIPSRESSPPPEEPGVVIIPLWG